MKTKETKRKNKKHTPKNDVGYGTKKLALDEMGMDNTDFDTLDDMFGGNPVEEFDDILDGVFDECYCEWPFLGFN